MLVTNYYRFKPYSIFGLVGTGDSITFVTRLSHVRRYVAVTACQLVVIWDTRRNIKVATLQCPEVRGTACVVSARPPTDSTPDNSHLAVGYSTGDVVVFSIKENQSIDPTIFDGHRGTVTSLAWDHAGMRLASAGNDGEIVIWDVLSERGVVRLRGHRGPVTRVLFLRDREVLVSSGKDGFVKFWDLPTAHCFRTIAPLNSEVWDIALVKDDTRLVVGGGDAVLQVWALGFTESADKVVVKKDSSETNEEASEDPVSKFFCLDTEGQKTSLAEDILPPAGGAPEIKLPDNDASILSLEKVGRLQRSKATRVLGLVCSGSILACYGKHNSLDLFKVHNDEEVRERIRRRLKKTRKRLRESGAPQTETETAACDTPQLEDEIRAAASLPVHGRLAGACVGLANQEVLLATLYADNSVAVLRWRTTDPNPGSDCSPDESTVCHINHDGHRSEVRVAQFTSVGDTLVTLSNDAVKTWHRSEFECVVTHTAPLTTLVRAMVIAPGDRHAVLGTASGHIMLLELATGSIIEDIEEAHGLKTEPSEVTALTLSADCKGLMSGGNDKNVRYWKFELVSDEAAGRRLSLESSGSAVSMLDSVTALDCSKDGRLLAVATMDNKETLYYADTMKLHQELYGKSLPTTSICFSSDGDILVTGSKDTAIRIYGTDFGDMRKLIKNAHTGGVTSVQFQASTHLFFSAGHDGCLNYWDADNFQRILTLKGHSGIVRCLTLPPKGNWVATSGQDSSLRLWEGTNELLCLEEEREEERRRMEEEEEGDELMAGQKKHVEGETKDAEAIRANKPSYKTDIAVDMILAGLNMYQQHLNDSEASPHYLMITYGITDPIECFCEILNRIKPSQLEEAIVQLELCQVLQLLVVLCRIGACGQLTEVSVRVALIAVRTNMPQLNASRNSLTILQTLNKHVRAFTIRLQDEVGFNRAGLKLCADRYEKHTEIQLFAEAMGRLSMQTKKKKRKEGATRRAILTL